MSAEISLQIDSKNPLERLSDALAQDMALVNEAILEKMHSDVALIPQLANYLIASGGKRLRPLLTLAATRIYNDTTDRPFGLAACVEFIHTATLLHDDVVDESAERRGKAAANLIFGNQASVLVGDFLFSRAFQLMTEDGSLEILKILSGASATIAEGEVLQLQATSDLETSIEQYYEIIGAKTAALFAAATQIGPVIAGQDATQIQAMYDYGYNLGMAFQIADDVLDYSAKREQLGKAIGDDFREGKMTAPVLIALAEANDKERAFWTRTMQDLDQVDGDLEQAMEILKRHNAVERSIEMTEQFVAKARAAIVVCPDHELKKMLDDVLEFTVSRVY